MSPVPLHYVELRAFCYATEVEDRVVTALRTLLPESVQLDRATSEGHHGDPIVVLSTRVERAEHLSAVLSVLGEFPDPEFDRVLAELDERIDEDCNLFLTLDKQAAFEGDIRLGEGITVRGKVEAYPAKKATAVENARDALEAA